MEYETTQIFESIDLGLIILDRNMCVNGWNRWMERHSGISTHEMLGKSIIETYPNLNEPKYSRLFKSVLSFGNYAYFSQKLHNYLIPLKNPHLSIDRLPLMPQNCSANPIRNKQGEITGLYIVLHDVTEYVTYEQKLLEITKLDPLTRLFNRSHLDKRLSEELERSQRHGNIFSVVMIDIDYFKKINDSCGHLCGDQTLRQMASLLLQTVRSMDVVGRYGGEEFCCLLPETDIDKAMILAERLRSGVEESNFFCGCNKFTVTISLGVAEYGDATNTLETLVGAADAALYRAKRTGRNRVVSAHDMAEQCCENKDVTA
jgi:diguanylate cyclase